MVRFWKYFFSPNVYRIHKSHDGHNRSYNYEPNAIEESSQKLLNFFWTSKLILTYSLPLWAVFLYRRGYYTIENLIGFCKLSGWASILLFGVYIVRGFGRMRNQEYVDFLDVLDSVHRQPGNYEKRRKMKTYDFDFKHWPVDFSYDEVEGRRSKSRPSTWKRISSQNSNCFTSVVFGLPKELAAYALAHSFGIRLVYPGSVRLLQSAYGQALAESRYKLVEEQSGIRSKLRTEDGNEIDSMFIDRRQRGNPDRSDPDAGPMVGPAHGDTLVVCCEGNAGFYEVGCMCTPIHCGYSVLGWNHPGFVGSTGMPFPEAEKNAMDAVMQYATHKLNFKPENIIIFAWSIGGFTAINAAGDYPDVKGLFLDATFNDIMPFAKKTMPAFAESLVEYTVRNHLDLHHSEHLHRFSGPVAFVRRLQDEVMNLESPRRYDSNLGNFLLEDFLRHRFPNLFEEGEGHQSRALWEWLNAADDEGRETVLSKWSVSSSGCRALMRKYLGRSVSIPTQFGDKLSSVEKTQMVLYLANKHMQHIPASHCTPLPPALFAPPWRVESVLDQSDSGSESSDFEVVQSSSSNL